EQFHPDRLASRILGMGDMLTLIEKAEAAYDQAEAEEAAQKLLEGQFTLEDFLDQMQQLKKMGPLTNLVGMLPGVPKEVRNAELDDSHIARVEAMIYSMTPAERADPDLIDASRRQRIATGSGTNPNEIANLLKQFKEVQKLMKQMGGLGTKRRAKRKAAKKGKKGGRVTDGAAVRAKGQRKIELPGLDGDDELRLPGLR
ncbi:MAG: signal recognition particle protein, partial [Acidimicrobiales bacterium]|nr:signal recognition particle protein [Acidimicrobiales bacterium]